jgi:hypothetical protein
MTSRAVDLQNELVERYTPDIDVPPPALLTQVRWNIEARVDLLMAYGALTAAELAELHGSKARNRNTLVDNWRRSKRVLTVSFRGRTLVPAFQITSDGSPHPVLAAVLPLLLSGGSEWAAALWFTAPNGFFDWAKPADLLVGRADTPVTADDDLGRRLVEAAEDSVESGAGFGTASIPDRNVSAGSDPDTG